MKKYKVIAKVDGEKFVKYHSHDLLSFTSFLDMQFPNWRYMNVFHNGAQIASYTKANKPTKQQP